MFLYPPRGDVQSPVASARETDDPIESGRIAQRSSTDAVTGVRPGAPNRIVSGPPAPCTAPSVRFENDARPPASVVTDPPATTAPLPLITSATTVVLIGVACPFASTTCSTGCALSGAMVSATPDGALTTASF